MGKQIHLKKVKELFDKSPVVEFKSVKRIVESKKKSNYAKLLISNLLKAGKIKKIGKGIYTKHLESSLSVFAFTPSYIGLQSSLSRLNLSEQETIPIILTTRKVRTGIRKIIDSNILIRKIDKKYFFGIEYVKEGDFYLPYSDLEKTFIDMIVYKQNIDIGTLKLFKKKINKKKIDTYLKKYSLITRKIIQEKLS